MNTYIVQCRVSHKNYFRSHWLLGDGHRSWRRIACRARSTFFRRWKNFSDVIAQRILRSLFFFLFQSLFFLWCIRCCYMVVIHASKWRQSEFVKAIFCNILIWQFNEFRLTHEKINSDLNGRCQSGAENVIRWILNFIYVKSEMP